MLMKLKSNSIEKCIVKPRKQHGIETHKEKIPNNNEKRKSFYFYLTLKKRRESFGALSLESQIVKKNEHKNVRYTSSLLTLNFPFRKRVRYFSIC